MNHPIVYYHLGNHPISFAVQMVANIAGLHLVHNDYVDEELASEKRSEHMLVAASNTAHIFDQGHRVTGDANIMRYLIARYMPNEAHLYPRDPNLRASCERLVWNLINSVCPLFADMQLAALAHPRDSVERDELMEEFVDDITFLEDLLRRYGEGRLFMYGDHLTVADLTLAAALTARYEAELELDELPRLASYLGRLELAIPGYQDIQRLVDAGIRRAREVATANMLNNRRLRQRQAYSGAPNNSQL